MAKAARTREELRALDEYERQEEAADAPMGAQTVADLIKLLLEQDQAALVVVPGMPNKEEEFREASRVEPIWLRPDEDDPSIYRRVCGGSKGDYRALLVDF